MTIVFKPHPAAQQISPKDYPALNFTITHDSLQSLLPNCQIAYTSVATSAAVEAYYAGLQVISVLIPETLNQSPLRGMSGVEFISSANELISAINKYTAFSQSARKKHNFFQLDKDLKRWQKLLTNSN